MFTRQTIEMTKNHLLLKCPSKKVLAAVQKNLNKTLGVIQLHIQCEI